MIERAHKLAFDFTAAFAEENVAAAAASLRVPTLLLSGGQSPYMTQRIVQRLGAIIDGAEVRHLPDAGHMLPLTHAAVGQSRDRRGISPAPTNSPAFRWRWKRARGGRPPGAGVSLVPLGACGSGHLVSMRLKPGMEYRCR